MTIKTHYSTPEALSDAIKSLNRYGNVTAMRVVGLALFVAGLLVIVKLAFAIYADVKEEQDPTTLRSIQIDVGNVLNGAGELESSFTGKRLDALKQMEEIEQIQLCYTVFPKLQYQNAPFTATLESAAQDDVLFGRERMRVGKGLQQEDEIVLTKNMADRLGVKDEDVEKGVKINVIQERTRDFQEEKREQQLKVVGICKGSREAGYVLESLAARMDAWNSSKLKSIDGRAEQPATAAFVYYEANQFPNIEKYANQTALALKTSSLKSADLNASTWATIDRRKIDLGARTAYPTYKVRNQNVVFVVVQENDPRLQYRRSNFNAPDLSLETNAELSSDGTSPLDAFPDLDVSENANRLETHEEQTVEESCDLSAVFGLKLEEGQSAQIVTREEAEQIVLNNNETLASWVDRSSNEERSVVYLNADYEQDVMFYQNACLANAISPYTPQAEEDLNVCEVTVTENTPEETSGNLLKYLEELDVRYVREKVAVDAIIDEIPVRLFGRTKYDPEDGGKFEDENKGLRTLQLGVADAANLGASQWTKGSSVNLSFTRASDSQKIDLKFQFVGIGACSKIAMDDAKDVVTWQNGDLAYDEQKQALVAPGADDLSQGAYRARILAKSTNDVIKLIPKLKAAEYQVYSEVEKIEGAKKLLNNLTSFVVLFNSVGFLLCLLNIVTTDFLVIRLRKSDVAAMIETGVRRREIFKEIFAETLLTAAMAYALVVLLAFTAGKPFAASLLALTGAEVTNFTFLDPVGVQLLTGAGVVTLLLASVAQISTVGFLARCKRPVFLK